MTSSPSAGHDLPFLIGGGELGAMIRGHDWASTPLDVPEKWPHALRTIVSVILGSKQPMFVVWGEDLTLIYNDAYAEILGIKHPAALASNFLEAWSEIRKDLVPLVDEAYAGTPVHMDDITLIMMRRGFPEETHFAFSYTPVRNDAGAVAGFFCPCVETTAQVMGERRIIAENERQRRLFERAPGFIAILAGPDHVFEFANAAYRKLIGRSDVVGKAVRDALPEIKGQGFLDWLDQVYRTGERRIAVKMPVWLNRAEDDQLEQRFVDFIYEPVTNPAGEVTGIFLEGYDVTEAHEAQEALRTSDEQFSALAQATPNIVWSASPDGTATWFNDWTYDYSGIEKTELLKDGGSDTLHDEDRNTHLLAWQNALAQGTQLEVESRLKRQDGEYRWHLTRAMPIRDDKGHLERWVGTSTDIHDQKMAAHALREINEQLEKRVTQRTVERDRVWRNSRDLLAVITTEGIFRAINPAWLEILGHQPDEVEGHHFEEFLWPEDLDISRAALQEAPTSDLTNFVNRFRHKDGTPRWISWHTSIEGELIYAYGRNITAEKEQSQALRQTEEQLRQAQKMEAVGQLTGGIAHDFNNLLTGISGSLELTLTRLAQGRPEAVTRYIEGAMQSAQRAAALTHRLLAFARRQPLDPKPVNVYELVDGMEDLLQRTLGPLYQIELSARDTPWIALCDAYQLETTILNIAINARDAMPDGGKLCIDVNNTILDYDLASRNNLSPGDYIKISIADNGIGMAPELLSKVFEPFFTTKPQGQGTGLGLSMVYGFVKQSGGHLEFDSVEGEGSTVTICLPRHDCEQLEATVAVAEQEPHEISDSSVLLVEDETLIRELVGESLKEAGYQVLTASDGVSGLQCLQTRQHFDLLITDIGLPGINGQQLAERALELRPDLKVLFITGYAENAVSEGFLAPGMQMMTKPFAVSALRNKVFGMLQQGAGPAA